MCKKEIFNVPTADTFGQLHSEIQNHWNAPDAKAGLFILPQNLRDIDGGDVDGMECGKLEILVKASGVYYKCSGCGLVTLKDKYIPRSLRVCPRCGKRMYRINSLIL